MDFFKVKVMGKCGVLWGCQGLMPFFIPMVRSELTDMNLHN